MHPLHQGRNHQFFGVSISSRGCLPKYRPDQVAKFPNRFPLNRKMSENRSGLSDPASEDTPSRPILAPTASLRAAPFAAVTAQVCAPLCLASWVGRHHQGLCPGQGLQPIVHVNLNPVQLQPDLGYPHLFIREAGRADRMLQHVARPAPNDQALDLKQSQAPCVQRDELARAWHELLS